jgi:hypothetical protein
VYQIVKNRFAIMVSATVVVVLMTVAGISAYKTHVEKDSGLFFSTYPHLIGTRMDGCEACHSQISALPPGAAGGKAVALSSCDYCAKAVVAIRVNPMPAGTMDIDWPRYATNAIREKSIIIFGALKP